MLELISIITIFAHSAIQNAENFVQPTIQVQANAQAQIPPANVNSEVQQEGVKATWYGNEFHGRLTASGEVYDQWGYTAAHNSIDFGTSVNVCNVANGKCVDVRITDRGGFGNGIDLSRGAFNKIAAEEQGVIYVELKY